MLTATLEVEIQVADGAENLLCSVPWQDRMTVLDATVLLRRYARLIVAYRGNESTAFVIQLGHAANQGAKGSNWVYRINGRLGEISVGAQQLRSDDHLEWSFEQIW